MLARCSVKSWESEQVLLEILEPVQIDCDYEAILDKQNARKPKDGAYAVA